MSIGLERFVQGIPFDALMFAPSPPAPAEPPDSLAAASCSSSIGRNSDYSADGVDDDADGEMQSSYKGPLDTMDALEDSLPIKLSSRLHSLRVPTGYTRGARMGPFESGIARQGSVLERLMWEVKLIACLARAKVCW